MLESNYTHVTPPKPPPPRPVRVSRRSQLIAALRQHARPIVIEDQELARPFARLFTGTGVTVLRACEVCCRRDILRDRAVLRREHRGALVHGPICPSGECTKSDPQTQTASKKALSYLLASLLRETEFPLVRRASESRDP